MIYTISINKRTINNLCHYIGSRLKEMFEWEKRLNCEPKLPTYEENEEN
jgi:hypothetical protein